MHVHNPNAVMMTLPFALVLAWVCVHSSAASLPHAVNYTETPIIALGLPKSGTTSLKWFLSNCNRPHINAVHYDGIPCPDFPVPGVRVENGIRWPEVTKEDTRGGCFVALHIQKAIVDGLPPLDYLRRRGFNAFTQMEVAVHDLNIWPQLDALNMILDAYPTAYYIHHTRDVEQHVSSIMRWLNAGSRYSEDLRRLGMLSRFPGQDANASTEDNLRMLVQHSKHFTRQAVLRRPGTRYLEVDVEGDPEAGAKLSIFLGAPHLTNMPHLNHNPHHPRQA